MNDGLISVIIPVYNVEDYLERCLKTVVNQSYSDLEIILVDDGSIDNSGTLCDKFAMKDSRIKVIHKKNGGLSSARNAGIDIATGEYIAFVDSDDWIDLTTYEKMYVVAKQYDTDLVIADYVIAKEEKEVNNPNLISEQMNKRQLFEMFFRVSDYSIHYCAWDKLYKTEILKRIRFTEGILFEDIDFIFKFINLCESAVRINQIFYYWYRRIGSITRNGIREKDKQAIDIWKNIYKQCRDKYPEYEHYAKMNYERVYLGLLGKACKYGVSTDYLNWELDYNLFLSEIRRNFLNLLKWKMPFSRKILLCIMCISPKIISVPFGIKNRLMECR